MVHVAMKHMCKRCEPGTLSPLPPSHLGTKLAYFVAIVPVLVNPSIEFLDAPYLLVTSYQGDGDSEFW